MSTAKKLVEKITARVFCHGKGKGGNPVTVFASQTPLASALQKELATQCEWESVMVASTVNSNGQTTSDDKAAKAAKLPQMAFYMPSGNEVSFCAHAAIGGAYAVSNMQEYSFTTAMNSNDVQLVSLSEEESGNDDDVACLFMRSKFEQSPVSHRPSLQRLLRERLSLPSQHLVQTYRQPPTFVNASVARPKTLVHVNSLQALRDIVQPPSLAPSRRMPWSQACESIDGSTGIYCYAQHDGGGNEPGSVWECRQFPSASGYPEDPATGIAAAALAMALFHQERPLQRYKFYQGMSMDRPSLIEVNHLRAGDDDWVYFGLQGRVEIDERENLEVPV